MSKSGTVARCIRQALLFALTAGCTIQMSAGTGAQSPQNPPSGASTPETAPEPSTETPKSNVKVNGAKLEVPGTIAFQSDSAAFGSGSEASLAEVKSYLEQSPRVTRLRIEGHTNNVRPSEQSLQLSGQRALAVKHWLRDNGINEGRLLAVGFGDSQPIASNADAAGQAQNERIAFRIAELDGKPYLGTDPLAGGTEFP